MNIALPSLPGLAGPVTLLWVLPLIGALLVLIGPNDRKLILKGSVLFSLLPLALSILVWLNYRFGPDPAIPQFQMIDGPFVWFPQIGSVYQVGVDGLSLPLVVLTCFLTPLALLMSYTIDKAPKIFFALFFMLQAAVIGAFVSLDLIVFFVFYEISLVPMYFIISQWGGANRRYASLKFMLFTMLGSLGMLAAIQVVGIASKSFDMLHLLSAAGRPFVGANQVNLWPANVPWQTVAFLCFSLAFALKVPIWPLHTWLPDAHTEAPTGGSMMLAGVLLKLGGYGFLRFVLPLFPDASHQFAPALAVLAMISIVLGAFAAWGMSDFKKLVAYSSVNHMGFVALGIAAAAYFGTAAGGGHSASLALAEGAPHGGEVGLGAPLVADYTNVMGAGGAALQMITHGLSSAAMFALVGVVYERAHTRDLTRFGGLWNIMPVYGAVLIFCAMGSVGLPGLAGFPSEFLVARAGWGSFTVQTAISMLGLLVTGIYVLKSLQKVLHGPLGHEWVHHPLKDMNVTEALAVIPLMLAMLALGLFPSIVLNMINFSANHLIGLMNK